MNIILIVNYGIIIINITTLKIIIMYTGPDWYYISYNGCNYYEHARIGGLYRRFSDLNDVLRGHKEHNPDVEIGCYDDSAPLIRDKNDDVIEPEMFADVTANIEVLVINTPTGVRKYTLDVNNLWKIIANCDEN
jgi:hypothetical protein